ncbi:MAG TPA: VOC family protein [Steroidobacteraceae bacterium]|nr:VOC family protein [Steroidobacteraceae bacterium]
MLDNQLNNFVHKVRRFEEADRVVCFRNVFSPKTWEVVMQIKYAMIFVSDMGKSVEFYRDVLGIPLRFQSPGWSEFATDGATLALHRAEKSAGAATVDEHGVAGNCRPGFGVPNLTEFHQRMIAKGVRCVQEPKSVFGSKVAQYADPDGLVFSVGEVRATS